MALRSISASATRNVVQKGIAIGVDRLHQLVGHAIGAEIGLQVREAAHDTRDLAPLVYEGHVIRDRGEMMNLTDMWKAAGEPKSREVFNWERFEGTRFIAAFCEKENLSATQVMVKKVGRSGGSWAHWQIGLAYAQYLSPAFHVWCNTVVRERMEEMGQPEESERRIPVRAIARHGLGRVVARQDAARAVLGVE